MKRLLTGALALLLPLAAFATTLNPVGLLNPTGSTSGKTIVSTGASTAPAWGNVPVANVTGAAALTGATFTGDLTVAEPSAALIMNDTSGTGFPQFVYRSNGTNEWIVFDAPTTHLFSVNRYVGGVFQDAPLTVSNSTGAVTMLDGITASPISGSTGSFTTLAATGNFTPSQTNGIVGTTTNNNANAGSVGEFSSNSTLATSVTTITPANATSISLTAGDWEVSGVVKTNPAGSTVISQTVAGISTTSATFGALGTFATSPLLAASAGAGSVLSSPVVRISLASTATVYLVANVNFSTSTCTVDGFIRARRVR